MKLDDLRDLPAAITVAQAADILDIGRNATYELAAKGEIPSLRLGRTIRIPTAPLLRMLGVDEGTDQTGQPQSVKDRRLKGQRSEP